VPNVGAENVGRLRYDMLASNELMDRAVVFVLLELLESQQCSGGHEILAALDHDRAERAQPGDQGQPEWHGLIH
jgi:hypothetical protein